LVVVALIVWFVFAVAIPLLMIDIAALALIAAVVRKEMSRWLLPLSVGGAVLVVADYNLGWFTKTLATNVSFLAGLIPVLLYANVLAGLIAAYFLIRNFMDRRNPHPERAGELTRRNVIAMGCLLLVGGLTVGLQETVYSQRRQARQSTAAGNPTTSRGNVATPVVGAERVQSVAASAFVGLWQVDDADDEAGFPNTLLKVKIMQGGRYQFVEKVYSPNAASEDSRIWLPPVDLNIVDGRLEGIYRNSNSRLTLELLSDGVLQYKIASENGVRTWKAVMVRSDARDLPYFMTRELVSSDLDGKSALELAEMRNEIYARHGRKFANPKLQIYFSSQSWYKPIYEPKSFPQSLLTPVQVGNVTLLSRREKQLQ
jgi:hypothetical protein